MNNTRRKFGNKKIKNERTNARTKNIGRVPHVLSFIFGLFLRWEVSGCTTAN